MTSNGTNVKMLKNRKHQRTSVENTEDAGPPALVMGTTKVANIACMLTATSSENGKL